MSHAAAGAIAVEAVGMTMRFGAFVALDDVSINVKAGRFHALLGENGAGKSTLVKCMMGFYRASRGELLVDGREQQIADPRAAHALGLGMVYQHFTLAPSLTGAENLLISREDVPRFINWAQERERIDRFMQTMPFKLDLDSPAERLSAGERQKLEILKHLYLGRRFLILDEPTSVMTPAEADEVLSLIRQMTRDGTVTVLMITHKFREVTAFADEVTVLRRGRGVGGGMVADLTHQDMAQMMVGDSMPETAIRRAGIAASAGTGRVSTVLSVQGIRAKDRRGLRPISIDSLTVSAGEIVGIAGVSGNGQTELMEILTGQRARSAGSVEVNGQSFTGQRDQLHTHEVRFLPEEPLSNACAPTMSVAENLSFRNFDTDAQGRSRFWLASRRMKAIAAQLAADFRVQAVSIDSPIASLSGGNVQRTVLARELSGHVGLLVISNPCFGLDFNAVREIRARIIDARNDGAAVLLLSEDLDEVLELADRVLVMAEGQIRFETRRETADIAKIGRYMAGYTP